MSEGFTSLNHGFALRASPAVKHGVSPLGTVGERAILLREVDAIRVRAESLIGFPNAIRVSADAIRLSTDILIVFLNAIRIFFVILWLYILVLYLKTFCPSLYRGLK